MKPVLKFSLFCEWLVYFDNSLYLHPHIIQYHYIIKIKWNDKPSKLMYYFGKLNKV